MEVSNKRKIVDLCVKNAVIFLLIEFPVGAGGIAAKPQ